MALTLPGDVKPFTLSAATYDLSAVPSGLQMDQFSLGFFVNPMEVLESSGAPSAVIDYYCRTCANKWDVQYYARETLCQADFPPTYNCMNEACLQDSSICQIAEDWIFSLAYHDICGDGESEDCVDCGNEPT